MRFIRWRVRSTEGFTLIELMVVIAIIGILSVMGLAEFNTSRARARDAHRKSDLAQIRLGLQLYNTDMNVFPQTIDNDPDGSAVPPPGSIFSLGSELLSYVTIVPRDPVNSPSQEYRYAVSPDRKRYVLCTPVESIPGMWYNLFETGAFTQTGACELSHI